MKFDYLISDKPNTDPFTNFNPLQSKFEANNSIHLYKIIQTIHNAGKNENIDGILLDLTEFQSPGSVSTKEIRDALKKFKKTGKFIYSYSTIFSQTAYYLASISDSIFMYPTGGMDFRGLSTTTPFFTETMKEIGIKPEIIRHGKFKAAVEPFMLKEMSVENKKQTQKILNDVWNTMLKDMSENRNLKQQELNEIANNLLITMNSDTLIQLGLIDSLIYPDELTNFLTKKTNVEDIDDLSFVSIGDIKDEKNKSKNKIAVIYAEGNIDGNTDNIHNGYSKTLKKVFDDDEIDAVVLRVNSPGGSALISDEILSQIKISKKEKPLIVSMGNVTASGGYYISCAADKILASPNTITGSIGVFGLFFTAEELLRSKVKLNYDNVKTNEFSNFGELNRSLSKKEKDALQSSVKKTYEEFITHVSEGRNITKEEVDKIGQGRVWSGLSAVNIGLVDSLGGLNDAINLAAEMAKLIDFEITEFPKSKNSFEVFFEDMETSIEVKKYGIQTIYLEEMKEKLLKMQGNQALLPIEYHLD